MLGITGTGFAQHQTALLPSWTVPWEYADLILGVGGLLNQINAQLLLADDSASDALEFTGSEMFRRLFAEGIELVEETASYLDGDGRSESRLLSRSASLSYASESMKLTTRLMQIASWLLAQRAVSEGNLKPETLFQDRYRLSARPSPSEAVPAEMPIALVEYVVRAVRLYDRVHYLDQKMYVQTQQEPSADGIMGQMDRLRAAFG